MNIVSRIGNGNIGRRIGEYFSEKMQSVKDIYKPYLKIRDTQGFSLI